MDYNLQGSSVHGTSQARILDWVATSFSIVFALTLRKWNITGKAKSLFMLTYASYLLISAACLVPQGMNVTHEFNNCMVKVTGGCSQFSASQIVLWWVFDMSPRLLIKSFSQLQMEFFDQKAEKSSTWLKNFPKWWNPFAPSQCLSWKGKKTQATVGNSITSLFNSLSFQRWMVLIQNKFLRFSKDGTANEKHNFREKLFLSKHSCFTKMGILFPPRPLDSSGNTQSRCAEGSHTPWASSLRKNCCDPSHIYGAFPGEGNATQSIILASEIPWTEELGGLPSKRSQRVRQRSKD